MSKPNKKSLDLPLPHFVVSFFPYDPSTLEGLLMHRGPNVRSVPNVDSIPSGLLEHSETFHDSIIREMSEEIGVEYSRHLDGKIKFHEIYRNIPGDGFDWVIGVWSVPIKNLRARAINMEPDKHSEIKILPLREIRRLVEFDEPEGFAPNIAGPLRDSIDDILAIA